ncbi:MAG: alpha/beta fold hydrolase [Actinomycetota bacterium]|nr:alpha/beta fold hydrolase [Actinomycetota bacterium]MDA2947624.1 alpha/beta fold hydrolase [Actinomycetota bacterium]
MPTLTDAITTPDGRCPVTLCTPDGTGPWPGIVMYPDAGGVRPAFREMAATLAALGYAVLLPDVYYRNGRWAPFDMKTVFADAVERNRIFAMMRAVTPEVTASDARAFFDYLQARPEVTGGRFGATGYCMGGRTALTVAGRVPDRVAAAMSFHGGGLADDDPDSPHLLADRIRAAVYVGAAENDPSYTPEQSALLDAALTGAGVEHLIEWYPAAHGFAVTDNAPYDPSAAERHWMAMASFFGEHLTR